jgi:hypothetical protein
MEYSKSTDFNISYDMLGNETNLTSIYPMLNVYETVIASILTIFTISSCISNFIIVFVYMSVVNAMPNPYAKMLHATTCRTLILL